MTEPIDVRDPLSSEERRQAAGLWSARWGGDAMITRGVVHRLTYLPAVIATVGGRFAGVAVYRLTLDGCELVSLDAVEAGHGVGSALLAAVECRAARAGAQRVWLVTSNDNLDALRFYQRRGYRIAAVHVGAIDDARRIKPAIPLVGEHGIPLHDEVELAKCL